MNSVEVTQELGIIKCDFESAKAYVQSRLDEYNGIIFTEDSKKDAKASVAELRKEQKEFAERVKEVKKEYMKPFDEFYGKACELIEMYNEPINFINDQVAEFERRRVEEKKEFINALYEECISDMMDILPLAKIYNPKWENATFNQKQIREELMEKKFEVKKGLQTLDGMESDVCEIAKKMYLDTFDLTECVMYITNHERQKAEILAREQERISREEEERIRAEERRRIEAEIRAEEEKQKAVEEAVEAVKEDIYEQAKASVIDELIPDLGGEANLYEYRISLTADAKQKLEMYMDSIGIDWEEM